MARGGGGGARLDRSPMHEYIEERRQNIARGGAAEGTHEHHFGMATVHAQAAQRVAAMAGGRNTGLEAAHMAQSRFHQAAGTQVLRAAAGAQREAQAKQTAKLFQTGVHGGRFYLSATGEKIYVSPGK